MNLIIEPDPDKGVVWTCYDEDTYDGAPDAPYPSNVMGYGRTADEAKKDWLDQIQDGMGLGTFVGRLQAG